MEWNELFLLKDAFRNSGLLPKIKHEFYNDIFGGQCRPHCRACRVEKIYYGGKYEILQNKKM